MWDLLVSWYDCIVSVCERGCKLKQQQANCVNNLETNKHCQGLADWISAVLKLYFCGTIQSGPFSPLNNQNIIRSHSSLPLWSRRLIVKRPRRKTARFIYTWCTIISSELHFNIEIDIKLCVCLPETCTIHFEVHLEVILSKPDHFFGFCIY